MSANLTAAVEAWGAALPAWVRALADACDAKSQGAVAKRLGVSSTMVNLALRARYEGDLDKLEGRVRGEILRETVACPVLGEITKRDCIDHQGRPYACTNAVRTLLFQACRGGCEHYRGEK